MAQTKVMGDGVKNSSPQPNDSKVEYVYMVEFKEPPLQESFPQRTQFCFTSLAAIYDLFSPQQIGCRVQALWEMHVSDGNKFRGTSCSIDRVPIFRKKRK